jgi:hypothetical protein
MILLMAPFSCPSPNCEVRIYDVIYKQKLGRPRRRWVVNIKAYLSVVGWGVVDWIDLAQDRDQTVTLGFHGMPRSVS